MSLRTKESKKTLKKKKEKDRIQQEYAWTQATSGVEVDPNLSPKKMKKIIMSSKQETDVQLKRLWRLIAPSSIQMLLWLIYKIYSTPVNLDALTKYSLILLALIPFLGIWYVIKLHFNENDAAIRSAVASGRSNLDNQIFHNPTAPPVYFFFTLITCHFGLWIAEQIDNGEATAKFLQAKSLEGEEKRIALGTGLLIGMVHVLIGLAVGFACAITAMRHMVSKGDQYRLRKKQKRDQDKTNVSSAAPTYKGFIYAYTVTELLAFTYLVLSSIL